MPEEVITERVEDVLKMWRDMVCYHEGDVHPLNHGAVMELLDRIEKAHKAEMKEVLDLLQKALDVCWKAECYFRWLNEQKKAAQ